MSETYPAPTLPQGFKIIKRDGSVVDFDASKIQAAIAKALLAGGGAEKAVIPARARQLASAAIESLIARRGAFGQAGVEDVQDHAELALMRAGEREAAKAYVLYRESHAQARAAKLAAEPAKEQSADPMAGVLERLLAQAAAAVEGLPEASAERIAKSALGNLYAGASAAEEDKALLLAARALIELEPSYSRACARLLLGQVAIEAWGSRPDSLSAWQEAYAAGFSAYIKRGVKAELLDPEMARFDVERLAKALDASRDRQLSYLGAQTLADRYLLNEAGVRFEMPQYLFMRVAMGLALRETDREARAQEFYELLSSFDFMSSTPTLFNAGTRHSQLSSCYLTTIPDDLEGIYEGIKENALLQKYAGGIGNDWTPVRALGARIKGTNGKSQGTIPFMKVANDTAVSVNQGGKRRGAVCGYLETWHLDIEEFLDLRKNTGDDRRRTPDMNTANWIPDLFMKRVQAGGEWTLFSPNDAPKLHELWGRAFEAEYLRLEGEADAGRLPLHKRVSALSLWRKMLTMLFETGHPWITFKDPCNARSPQRHAGVVHSSNLCSEITLNTSDTETAVCNLGSVNLPRHMRRSASGQMELDLERLRRTVAVAMRMLDNVVDINFYGTRKARDSNLRHRPVGMGMMGHANCLVMMGVPFASNEAVEFADYSAEAVCQAAYSASADLARERGVYSSYEGSLWSQGIFPQDSVALLREERGGDVEMDESSRLDWTETRAKVAKYGMRNSNCVAIAPTATISNIVGVEPCIEPIFQTLFVKSNLSGEFTIINEELVAELKKIGAWDEVMSMDLKHFDGDLDKIDRVPDSIRALFATAFKIDPKWLVEAASRRQKWIDQSQSLNIYMAGANGKKLDEIYRLAWKKGLKTTYYLRTIAATAVEKSTSRHGGLNAVAVSVAPSAAAPASPAEAESLPATDAKFCSIDNPDCEACQ